MHRLIMILALFYVSPSYAAEVTDATGRSVTVPDRIEHVLPAGPPASVLLAAIAPGQMLGYAGPISEAARSDLANRTLMPIEGRMCANRVYVVP